jgi:hypothetical protein
MPGVAVSWVVALHKHGRWGEIVNAVGCGNEEGREMITASMPNIFTREIDAALTFYRDGSGSPLPTRSP